MPHTEDMLTINAACQGKPERLRDALYFVVGSIRTQFSALPAQLDDVHERGSESKHLWGFKGESWEYITANYFQLWLDASHALNSCASTSRREPALMRVFLRVPGLGLAKAGFACQLFAGCVGCIDSHNAKLYGVGPAELRLPKSVTEITQLRKIQAYCDLCDRCGGSGMLWDAWCELIAHRQAKHWEDGAHVSRAHVEMCIREVT